VAVCNTLPPASSAASAVLVAQVVDWFAVRIAPLAWVPQVADSQVEYNRPLAAAAVWAARAVAAQALRG
jgi:hypothetical protein